MKTPKPIAFPEANKTLGKPASMTDAECSSMPVYTDGRECISCWKLPWRQRLAALFFGKVWLSVLTGSGTQPPVWIDCARTVFIEEEPKE